MSDTVIPAAWLTSHAHLLPRHGDALDVACGRGRHALWLASLGLTVTAIDRDTASLENLGRAVAERGLPVVTRELDLEAADVSLGRGLFDVIVVVHYLHRPLFPALIESLRPGGILIYETFTRAQAAIGRPKSAAFLLEPGELVTLVGPLSVMEAREGFHEGRHVASVVAQKPTTARP